MNAEFSFYEEYVQQRIDVSVARKFECLRREHKCTERPAERAHHRRERQDRRLDALCERDTIVSCDEDCPPL